MAAYISFQPSDFFNTKLYTGTGASNAQTGVGFQPDLTWIKNREATDFHVLTDAVRGVTKYIKSNTSQAEDTDIESLKSFDSDGFTVGDMAEVNTNTEDYVSWNWKAGTTTGIAGSPSITPIAYSFNATSGFSIIKYEGTGVAGVTLPHGLGVAPDMIIIKLLTSVDNWPVYNTFLGATKYSLLSLRDTVGTATSLWNDTAPTSTLFSIGNSAKVNDTDTYIAYCFTNIKGFSKFSGYYGNGNVNGTFVYTGFRPAFVMIKKTSGTSDWYIYDDSREGYNNDNDYLLPNETTVEGTADQIQLFSNGFKLITVDGDLNTSAGEYIYSAFAKFPLVSSNSKAATAR